MQATPEQCLAAGHAYDAIQRFARQPVITNRNRLAVVLVLRAVT
jgi:hypothetical protein